MKDEDTTKEQLMDELTQLRQRITELEKSETERKRKDDAFRESEAKYRSLVEDSIDGIAIVREREIKFVNQALLKIFGYQSEDEMVGHIFTDFVSPEYRDLMMRRGLAREMGADVPRRYEFKGLRKDGTEFNAELSVSRIDYQGGVARQGVIRDITERKQAEEELRSSREQLRNLSTHLQSVREEERSRVAREIHDELGQGLAALKMDLSWLGNKLPKDQESLLKRTKSMATLIDTILQKVQRISAELRPGLLDHLGLTAAIEWQAKQFRNRTGINYEVAFDPEDIILDKDRSTAVFRIFQETLSNVARHAKATRVEVSLKEKAGKLEVKVRDNGRGITKKQIFDPKSFGLMGIRERARHWGGEVKISGIRSYGTTVTLSIPLQKEGRE